MPPRRSGMHKYTISLDQLIMFTRVWTKFYTFQISKSVELPQAISYFQSTLSHSHVRRRKRAMLTKLRWNEATKSTLKQNDCPCHFSFISRPILTDTHNATFSNQQPKCTASPHFWVGNILKIKPNLSSLLLLSPSILYYTFQ